MITSSKQLHQTPSAPFLDAPNQFKIRMPLSNKRLTSYKSWRKINISNNRNQETYTQRLPSYLRLIKNYAKDSFSITDTNNTLGQMITYKIVQREEQQDSKNSCTVYIVKGSTSTKLKIRITTIGNLINHLRGRDQRIIGFSTISKSLNLDFYLTLFQKDGSFLNGNSLRVQPIYRIRQKIITLNSFQVIQCIGTGGFSKVFLCRFLQDGKMYAMKVINKQFIVKHKKKKIVMNEKNIMKELDHPFIIQMKFCFQSRESLVFILEYCPGGELFGLVKKFKRMKQQIARFYIIEILLGLEKVHQSHIIYRDFKPENILIDIQGHVRIADFGLAKPEIYSTKDRALSFCGSPQYMPPQMIMKQGHSFPVDFYCIGALLYELVTGLPPFYNRDPNKIYKATISQQISFPKHTKLSKQLQQLLFGLLTKDQKFRIGSLSGVKEILAHPWFGKINKQEYLTRNIKPPVLFEAIQDFRFNFEDIKEDNMSLVADVKRQQKQQKKAYSRVMNDFYYDYRAQLKQHAEFSSTLHESPSVTNLSTRRTMGVKQNFLSCRSKTSNTKYRKNMLQVEMGKIKLSKFIS